MEKKEKKTIKFEWIYLFYSPYIILMGASYLMGVSISFFHAFFTAFVDRDMYHQVFIDNEKNFRKIFLSMFDK